MRTVLPIIFEEVLCVEMKTPTLQSITVNNSHLSFVFERYLFCYTWSDFTSLLTLHDLSLLNELVSLFLFVIWVDHI